MKFPIAAVLRTDDELFSVLREISTAGDRPVGQVIETAFRQYKRGQFWRQAEESIERLRLGPVVWKAHQDEIALLEGGSVDGLQIEEPD